MIQTKINIQHQGYLSTSFGLIWYYWFRKYMSKKPKKTPTLLQLSSLRQKYQIQTIEPQSHQPLKKKLQQLSQKYHPSALQSSFSSTTSTSTNNSILYWTIIPETQSNQIQQQIIYDYQNGYLDIQEGKDMINQLFNYYRNSKNVFVIFRNQRDREKEKDKEREKEREREREKNQKKDREYMHGKADHNTNVQNFSQANRSFYEGSLLNSRINLSSILNEDDSMGDRNDSILEADKIQDRIQNMEIVNRLADNDGFQLWNVKYFNIPHTFIKIKKACWSKFLTQPIAPSALLPYQLHPSHPKPVPSLPLLPRLHRHRPSIDKLHPFTTYLKLLWQHNPQLSPVCESIFQYNGFPYIFCQDVKQQNIGVLCYYVVFGNQDGNISQKMVDRWIEGNPGSMLAGVIGQMREVVRRKNVERKGGKIGLFQTGDDAIW